jgi:chromosomal replication initiation ATPase DnaA
MTIWDAILERLRPSMPEEDFRRWFTATAYASDAGDQITVWVPTEAIRRHILIHYRDEIAGALEALGREGVHLRLVVGGLEEDEESE